jgi:hypothetical protein
MHMNPTGKAGGSIKKKRRPQKGTCQKASRLPKQWRFLF